MKAPAAFKPIGKKTGFDGPFQQVNPSVLLVSAPLNKGAIVFSEQLVHSKKHSLPPQKHQNNCSCNCNEKHQFSKQLPLSKHALTMNSTRTQHTPPSKR
jgi:hypothetical protein